MKISKREVKIFLIGFISCIVLQSVYDWEKSVSEFKRGWNSVAIASNASNEIV